MVLRDRKFDERDGAYLAGGTTGDAPVYEAVVLQVDDYYPFGLRIDDQARARGQDYEFTYTGKEEVAEIGLNWQDYGARWFDVSLARFCTVDRYAHKFTFQSPYAYAGNSPISFLDINGDSILIHTRKSEVSWENGKLFNKDGSSYDGKVRGYLRQANNALNDINGTEAGADMLLGLASSTNKFVIRSGLNSFRPDDHGSPGINLVTNNTYALQVFDQGKLVASHLPFEKFGDGGDVNWNSGGVVTLAHEIAHASDADKGLLDSRVVSVNGGSEEIREIRAVYKENLVRGQLGLPLRISYSGGASLINNGRPTNYEVSFLLNMILKL